MRGQQAGRKIAGCHSRYDHFCGFGDTENFQQRSGRLAKNHGDVNSQGSLRIGTTWH